MSISVKKAQTLGVFSLAMITAGSVDSVRNLPATALFGGSIIFFFVLAAIFFLIPGAMVSSELASTCSESGGVYVWLKQAFGRKAGFVAVWYQWVENVFYFPALLSFVVATLAYVFSPALAHDKTYIVLMILLVFWLATLINIMGIKISAMLANFATIFGLILPMAIIIVLGIVWLAQGQHLQIAFTLPHLLPNFHQSGIWVALTGIILSLCGIELATVYGNDVRDPQRAYPKALLISSIIIVFTLICGGLSIAIVLPEKQISLVAGIMQACELFLAHYHLKWMLPLMALMLVLGGVGTVNNWIIAPVRGLLIAAADGHLPKHMSKKNKQGAPYVLLLYQAIIVSATTLVYYLMPSVNASYWLLTVLTAQLYMFMYIMLFAAGIRLRFKNVERKQGFMIPGGKIGMIIVCAAGLIGCVMTICVGFIPPSRVKVGGHLHYELLIIGGLVIMSLPAVWACLKKESNS
jgi:amino acid transporter